jgi:hypothetical protein
MQSPSPAHCRLIVPLLKARDGQSTKLELSGPRSLEVFNIAWGEDIGDDYEHITTNISPEVNGTTVDLFFADEVASVIDPASGKILWETDGALSVR